MILKIGDKSIKYYNGISVTLRYDSVADTFGMNLLFEPSDSAHRKLFLPGSYNLVTLEYNNEVVMSGVMLSQSMESAGDPPKYLMQVGGYSRTGVLEDCQMAPTASNQSQNKSLLQMAEALLTPFGLKVVADDVVKSECEQVYFSEIIDPDQTIKDFLTKLAVQKNIVLSHTVNGDLLFTRADTTKKPIFDFNPSYPAICKKLIFNGQAMHDTIYAQGQANADNNASDASIKNPYVQKKLNWMQTAFNSTVGVGDVSYSSGYRPKVSLQTAGNDNDTPLTARQLLAQELKEIRVEIKIYGWTLNGKVIRPNNIITIIDPELFLYQKTRWFIESVTFSLEKENFAEVSTLTCVLPECYNNLEVKNVFTGTNLTVPYSEEKGAHAVITPFI